MGRRALNTLMNSIFCLRNWLNSMQYVIMLRTLIYVYHFIITFLKEGERIMVRGDFSGERAVPTYSEHVHLTFFIHFIFFIGEIFFYLLGLLI